jgi:fatty acid desaturase
LASVTQFTPDEERSLAEKHTLPRMLSIPFAGLGMALNGLLMSGAVAWDQATPWMIGLLVAFTASMMFCWTSALHEAAHQTLFKSRSLSIWCGRLLGTMMFTPYTAYREVHIRHHAYLNTPRDWELWPYSDPNASLGFRRAFVWFDLLCGIASGPIIYGRIYFHRNSPIKSAAVRREIRNEYIAIAALWGGIWLYVGLTHQWAAHLLVVIAPMYIAAFMQTFRKFTEHLGMASFDPLQGTRTVLPRKWLLRLSSFLNFDIFIHGPHHRHPRLTHTTLEEKLHEYQRDNPEVNYPAYERYWKAMLAMFPSMIFNPGCGVNAGNTDGHFAAPGEAEDFASDVVPTGGKAAMRSAS